MSVCTKHHIGEIHIVVCEWQHEKEIGEPCVPSRPKKSRHASPPPLNNNAAIIFDDPAVLQKVN